MAMDKVALNRSEQQRQIFFDITIKHEKIRDCISGNNEQRVIKLFDTLEFVLGKDYVRQHPVGQKYVLDFAFINEQVAIEADGKNHRTKTAKRQDLIRDRYLRRNGWVTIRVQDEDLFGYKMSFFKNLIKEVILERREQYENGKLYPIDFSKFNENDYDFK